MNSGGFGAEAARLAGARRRHGGASDEWRHLLFATSSILLVLVACGAAALLFVGGLATLPDEVPSCIHQGITLVGGESDPTLFQRCLEQRAQRFFDRDYSEAKDLSKSFLTLLTAILVASITFSEKIVDLGRSSWWARGSMVACWVLLLSAIAACGAGLTLMTYAAGVASYAPGLDYFSYEVRAMQLYIVSGVAFGTGLASLLVAGLISLVERHLWAASSSTTRSWRRSPTRAATRRRRPRS